MFEGTGIDLRFAVEQLPIDPGIDPAAAFDFYVGAFGPLIAARRTLEPEGRWEALATRLRPVVERMVREPATYLLITGRKVQPRAQRS